MLSRRRHRPPPHSTATGVSGRARVDSRTKDLTKRLRPGDIAIIDHEDIDRVSGQALVSARPAAVINAAACTSGRYPNHGPELIVEAGIPLLDRAGAEVMVLSDGAQVRLDGETLYRDYVPVASGKLLTPTDIEEQALAARSGLNEQLEAFAANTMHYLVQERDLLLDGVGVPDIRTELADRHALIVVRGHHYQEDLAALRHYIREYRPVLIGVDGGADALLDAGHTPDLIVGDMDSVTDTALRSGAELVVHAYPNGTAPGQERLQSLGLTGVPFPATGTSEDIAMLLADEMGASLIVAVGTHATLVDFLDKGRAGMASTFLTRLRVGGKLVDAKGVSRLYRSRLSLTASVFLLASGLAAVLVAMWASPAGRTIYQLLGARWDDLVAAISGLLT